MSNNAKISNKPTKIFFFCFDYKKDSDIEAIKKEAQSYFKHFSEIDRLNFDFKFISLEKDIDHNQELTDEKINISFWGYKFDKLLKKYSPDIIHVFSDSLEGYHIFESNFSRYPIKTIYTVTGMNPMPRYEPGYLTHLRHLIDVGNLHIVTQSPNVKNKLLQLGIRSTRIMSKSTMRRDLLQNKKSHEFTIGFASSPMSEHAWEERGVNVLLQLASIQKHYRFKIAWRNNSFEKLQKEINELQLNNVEVSNGYIDMYEFYSDVDAIIAPYLSSKYNHSSPLSIVESIALGIPVIITNEVGISDYIETYNFGVISEPTLESINDKIIYLKENYSLYKEKVDALGEEIFYLKDSENHEYFRLYHLISKQISAPTLKTWQDDLIKNQKYLVMGKNEIAHYYNDDMVAKLYDENRFSEYPMRTFDLLERATINHLIDTYSNKEIKQKKLLDIASGDGRILRELTQYGYVSALENSGFMISVSAKKLDSNSKVIYIKDNFFDFNTIEKFEVITIFRFLRHYDYCDRKEIYRKLHNLISEDGIIICDFPNKIAETQLRNTIGWEHFNVYDVFWHDFEVKEELMENHFEVIDSISIGEMLLPDKLINPEFPLASVICFRKIKR